MRANYRTLFYIYFSRSERFMHRSRTLLSSGEQCNYANCREFIRE